MDPKQTGKQLDPTLQAAYDRVMGFDPSGNINLQSPTNMQMPPDPTPPVPPQPPTTPPPVDEPMPPAPPVTEPGMPPIQPPVPPQPTIPPAMPSLNQADASLAHPAPHMLPQEEPLQATVAMPQVVSHDTETVKIGFGGSPVATAAPAKGKGISPAILIVGAFVFLAVYALFWVRYFNLPLPFLGK